MKGSSPDTLHTLRLRLRRWRAADQKPFSEINADPEVVEFLPRALSRMESDELMNRLDQQIEDRGFGLWAVETSDEPFIGFVGLSVPSFKAHFTPCVEVGWRLARKHWGKGYATEGARAALDYAFQTLKLTEVVSFTSVDNVRSRRVMERLKMSYDPEEDFEHPALVPGHPLRPHVLYRMKNENFGQ